MMPFLTSASASRALARMALAIAIAGAAGAVVARAAAGQASAASGQRDLRDRVEARYEVVPLSRGIGLRPRARVRDIRMIEIADGTIAIDGAPVTGRELRERLAGDADLVLQLSYLDPDERRALFAAPSTPPAPREAEPEAKEEARERARPPAAPERPVVERRRTGERVRVLGSVTVDRDEAVDGQVVAVLGSVRVDGEVSDQVVAVLGSVDLGPEARVRGDVIAVGGRIRRAPGSEIGGSIREISVMAPDVHLHMPGGSWIAYGLLDPFTRIARLVMTLFRLFLLGLLGSILVLIAREPIERLAERVRTEPLRTAVVGLLAELLFLPALVLTTIVLAISIIGIPLLLFMPFVLVALLIALLVGFIATAYAVGGWAATRLGWADGEPYRRIWIGVAVILAPLLLARLLAFMGAPIGLWPLAVLFATVAFLVEFVVWTIGFGAALIGVFETWRARRAAPLRGTSL